MSKSLIVAAGKIIDGSGSMTQCDALLAQLDELAVTPVQLAIDPLNAGWHSPLKTNHFRSGCAPIEALARARQLIEEQGESAVIINGEDRLKSDYDRIERAEMMSIYGADYPITHAYNDLSGHFIQQEGITESLFKQCAEQLFDNYKRTYVSRGSSEESLPGEKWYNPITSRFRGVDCANPQVDFRGTLVLVSEALASKLDLQQQPVAVSGVDIQKLEGDGREYIGQISSYRHLQTAYRNSCRQADIDFATLFKSNNALLEVYSCYPVVPMAFLLVSGLIESIKDIPALLKSYAVTVTGGMNLARAPWNNPALNGLVSMYQQLQHHDSPQEPGH